MTSAVQSRLPAFLSPNLRMAGWARGIAPLALLLAWTCVCRLPFAALGDEDEFFFAVVGQRWLHGLLPYAASFDIKPPGLFAIFAIAEAICGASLATIKAVEIAFTAFGAWALYGLMDRNVSRPAAIAAAAAFPVYSLVLSGVSAANMLVQLPFFILAFDGALIAARDPKRMWPVFWAGLSLGGAGMVKQTAIFEAAVVFALLLIYTPRARWIAMTAVLGLGAALPAVAFCLYFLANGHFADLFDAVIRSAVARTSPDVMAGYKAEYGFFVTPLGALLNAFLLSTPLIVLWFGTGVAVFNRTTINQPKLLVAAGLWTAAALAEVVYGRMLCTYYLLSLVPPLLVLAATGICHGLSLPPQRRILIMATIGAAALVMPLVIDRANLFSTKGLLTDYAATQEIGRRLRAAGVTSSDRLLVLNRGYDIYLESGAAPPTRYIHSTHTMTAFHTPSPDALGENLNARPDYIVVADPSVRALDESPARYARALAFIAQNYSLMDRVQGRFDSFQIYRRKSGG